MNETEYNYNLLYLEAYANTIQDSPKSTTELKVEGRRKTIKVIAYALYAMGLEYWEAIEVIDRWNYRLQWVWTDKDLKRLIEYVEEHHDYEYQK